MKLNPIYAVVLCAALSSCGTKKSGEVAENRFLDYATETLDSVYARYGVAGQPLLKENYPDDESYRASYLASDEPASTPNKYSYLWPYSGTLSAVSAIYEVSGNKRYDELFATRVTQGLEEYADTLRFPAAYSSYINTFPLSDRFYDDNIWVGIDMADMYGLTKKSEYLDKALTIWRFIESGTDDALGGGIYWCEQKKGSKNTCSNAPGAVLALKIFKCTSDSSYLQAGKDLYDWTKSNLMDTTDCLYFDNINLKGEIGKAKYAYNSGQMIQAASLLYKLTGEKSYLEDAQKTAAAAHKYFFNRKATDEQGEFDLLGGHDIWFADVMLRGFIELYNVDKNPSYLNTFGRNLDYAWNNARDKETGLFHSDWSGEKKDDRQWLLTQTAMSEMYARMAPYIKK